MNGSLASTVTLNGGDAGRQRQTGGLVANGGTLAPGNSIGTLNVNGNFTQNGGTYEVEVNAQGQSDRIHATGTATINGGSVQVLAQWAPRPQHHLHDPERDRRRQRRLLGRDQQLRLPDAYIVVRCQQRLSRSGAEPDRLRLRRADPNQFAVGTALDQTCASATGDFDTVLNALPVLTTQQGPMALNRSAASPMPTSAR